MSALAIVLRACASWLLARIADEDDMPYGHSDHYAAHVMESTYAAHDTAHLSALASMTHTTTEMVCAVMLVVVMVGVASRAALALAFALFRCADTCEVMAWES